MGEKSKARTVLSTPSAANKQLQLPSIPSPGETVAAFPHQNFCALFQLAYQRWAPYMSDYVPQKSLLIISELISSKMSKDFCGT